MLVANMIAILVVLGCAGYQYKKGNLVQSFASLVIAICATAVAFGYFETLAGLMIGDGEKSRIGGLTPWAYSMSFAIIFVVLFAVLQTVIIQILRKPVDLGTIAERAGRLVCGLVLGLVCSGVLIITLLLAPLSTTVPYARFNAANVNIESPAKVMLNVDGFATGWGNLLSAGSFSGKTSFAALHPNFLDQLYLNGIGISEHVPLSTKNNVLELPKKREDGKIPAVWAAGEGMKGTDGRAINARGGHTLMIVRVGFKRRTINDSGRFTPSQFRLVCKQKNDTSNILKGNAQSVFAIGYLTGENQLEIEPMNKVTQLMDADFTVKTNVLWRDFAFYVPNGSVPVMLGYKQNVIMELPRPIPTEDAPAAISIKVESDNDDSDDEDGETEDNSGN
jgi:hypothetical protein